MYMSRKTISALFALTIFASPLHASGTIASAAAGVASAHPLATAAGVEILRDGGNAFDAAVAISAALAVVEPAGSGLGGGGFWLLHNAADGSDVMLDGREKAPLAAHRDMYLDAAGEVVKGASVNGVLAAAIPGAPAAVAWLAKHRGALPLAASLAPAIRLAADGFVVDERYQRLAKFRRDTLNASPAAAEIFLLDGEVPPTQTRIVQHDLAATLKALARDGHDGFYRGAVAQKLLDGVRDAGGIWTRDDLESYAAVVREPVVARYKNMKITSAALPSSGGLVMALTLNILQGYELNLRDANFVHLVTEAMRRAYRDRALYMGDSDFVAVPSAQILDANYAAEHRNTVHKNRATPSASLASTDAITAPQTEGTDTTHFSVVDAAGNRVAATLSINYPFGSGFVAPGTGVLLNDEMDDFSVKPGAPNVYGLVGGDANAIAGGKRMLSSMSPTFLETDQRIAVLGTPGGSRIISMLILAALEFQRGDDAQTIVDLPRFHHQYLPDEIQYEPDALSPEIIAELEARGHKMKLREREWGNMQAVIIDRDNGKITAASDRRGIGAAMVLE